MDGKRKEKEVDEVHNMVLPSSLTSNPQSIEELRIGNNGYNDGSVTELKLNGLARLKRIVIGDECFGKVRVVELDGLGELESVVIGKDSFTNTKCADHGWNEIPTQGSFRIQQCPKLKSIQIGDWSLADYFIFSLIGYIDGLV